MKPARRGVPLCQDSIIQPGHPQSDLGRARVGELTITHGDELLPGPQRGRKLHRVEASVALSLELQPTPPRSSPEDGFGAEDADVRVARLDRLAASVKGYKCSRRQSCDDGGERLDGTPIVVGVGRHFHEPLSGEVGDGIEHMGACVDHEAAAGDLRHLSPFAARARPPALPDGGADAQDLAKFSRSKEAYRLADLGRQAAVEGYGEELACPIACLNEAERLPARSSPLASPGARPDPPPDRPWPDRSEPRGE